MAMTKRKKVPGPSMDKVMKKKSPGSSVSKGEKRKREQREEGSKRKLSELVQSELPDVKIPLSSAPDVRIPVSNFSGSAKSAVIYVGRIPHGFYEDQMRGFFSQFGDIRRLRLSRNKKTGKSKHFAFIEFVSPEVAPIVAEAMHNYLLFESMLQVKVVPPERISSAMWRGANKQFKIIEWQKLAREHHNRVRTPKEQARLLGDLVKKDQKRRRKLQEAGIDYDYPEFKTIIPPSSKKIKFHDDDEDS